MRGRHNFYFLLFILYFFVISLNGGWAQTNVTSPYSGFGLGDIKRSSLSRNFGMGGVGNAFADPFAINPNNPASYSSLQTMTLDFSAFGTVNTVQSNQQSVTLNSAGLYGLAFVFKKQGPLAIGAGISPYSTIGYKFSNFETIRNDTTKFVSIRTGQGGLVDYHIGASYQFFKKKLNIGFSLHYLDGKADVQWITQVPLAYAKVYLKDQSFNGFTYQLGAIFSDTLKAFSKETFYRIGGCIEIAPAIRSTEAVSLNRYRNFLDISDQNVPINPKELILIQTLSQQDITNFSLPIKYSIGLATEKFLHYSLGLDVNIQDWKNFALQTADQPLGLSLSIFLGGEWIPNYRDSKSIISRTAYRLGLGWEKTYLTINQQAINNWHLNLGIGIPVNIRIPSRVNLGMEVARRGTLENNLIQETTFRFVIGINFNEIWFGQRKFH